MCLVLGPSESTRENLDDIQVQCDRISSRGRQQMALCAIYEDAKQISTFGLGKSTVPIDILSSSSFFRKKYDIEDYLQNNKPPKKC